MRPRSALASSGARASDGSTVVNDFSPGFGQQYADISYGLAGQADAAKLIDSGAEARVLAPAEVEIA